MSKNSFHAMNWLNAPSKPMDRLGSPVRQDKNSLNISFDPKSHLTPGWKGDGLLSKEAIKLRKAFIILWKDANLQIRQLYKANQSLKNTIYNQYKIFESVYGTNININKQNIDLDIFWEQVQATSKLRDKTLDRFVKSFTFKAVCLYIYKVKFLGKITTSNHYSISETEIQNPNFALRKLFKKGSLYDINAESLEINSFSWFRPSQKNPVKLRPLLGSILNLSITELMKITSVGNYLPALKQNYSHSFSHRSFGNLLNELLVSLPLWLGKSGEEQPPNLDATQGFTISTKFLGEHMPSMSQSYWLAQENSLEARWKYVVCPEFHLLNDDDNFLKLTHELQFLFFLCDFAIKQKKEIIPFITKVWKNKVKSYQEAGPFQTSLFTNGHKKDKKTVYDRLVLNLVNLPKANPHHFLFSKINDVLPELNRNGYIYVFTDQKLFVPSQSERINHLLKNLEIKAEFEFKDLKGKGEIQDHLYVLRKKDNILNNLIEENKRKKTFSKFSWSGSLKQFNIINTLCDELHETFNIKSPSTPFYLKELDGNIEFKLNPEIIFNGKLLSQNSLTDQKVTHPSFLKSLTQSTRPLEHFFKIEAINQEEDTGLKESILFSSSIPVEDKYNYVLIVHLPNSSAESVEIVPSSSYLAKKSSYGIAYYQYFGLIPKVRGLNVNIFREFFNSPIGKQIILVTLTGGWRKLKPKVDNLLVPAYFENSSIPHRLYNNETFRLFLFSPENIENFKLPDESIISESLKELKAHAQQSPGVVLSLLSNFKLLLTNYLNSLSLQLTKEEIPGLNFQSILIQRKLTSEPLSPIFGNNEDLYIELLAPNKVINLSSFERSEIIISKDKNGESSLTLHSDCAAILKIHSGPQLLKFLNFFFKNFKGKNISGLINSIEVPSNQFLENLFYEINGQEKLSKETLQKINQEINSLITQKVISN